MIVTKNKINDVRKAFEVIQAKIDLKPIIQTLNRKESSIDVDTKITLYKQWLSLKSVYDGEYLPPNELIDEVWHEHILHTEKYMEDCKIIFGKYLHHYPNLTEDESEFSEQNANQIKLVWNNCFGEEVTYSFKSLCKSTPPTPACDSKPKPKPDSNPNPGDDTGDSDDNDT
jgi:hypothetical protein